MTAFACPVCGHPVRRHGELGCTAAAGECLCDLTAAAIADEPAAATSVPVVIAAVPEVLDEPAPPAEAVPDDDAAGVAAAAEPEAAPVSPEAAAEPASEPLTRAAPPRARRPRAARPAAAAAAPAPTASAEPVSTGRTWWCHPCSGSHLAPGRCPACGGELARARVEVHLEAS